MSKNWLKQPNNKQLSFGKWLKYYGLKEPDSLTCVCPICGGDGKIYYLDPKKPHREDCDFCHGQGYITSLKLEYYNLSIKLEKIIAKYGG